MGHGSPALHEALLSALPPLHRKVRASLVNELARRAQLLSGDDLSVVARLSKVLRGLYSELLTAEQSTAQLAREWTEAGDDPKKRQAVLREHIKRTVADTSDRKADFKSLRRFMSVEALKERCDRQKLRLFILEETALQCLTGVLRDGAPTATDDVSLARWLFARVDATSRMPVRLAAMQALTALLATSANARTLKTELTAELRALITANEGRAFLQSEALRALFILDVPSATALLKRRLAGPYASDKDFLFRREALAVASRYVDAAELLSLLDDVLLTDPSEWVRMGVCELLFAHGERGHAMMARLFAANSAATDQSHLVRAQVALTLCAQLSLGGAEAVSALAHVTQLLRTERHPTVLRITCERLIAATETAANEALEQGAAALTQVLGELEQRPGLPGLVIEACASTALALRRFGCPVRLAWTRYLAEQVAGITVGKKAEFTVSPAPSGLPSLPEDPAFLGAILADLSRDDFGLSAKRKGSRLVLWRGDRFQRQLWRIWHEMRRPAPNKRQAFIHTIGRKFEGTLRAPPMRLDEITETMVPGERVHVPSQGGWARHVPTVDDLVSLPLTSADEVKLFSSHGITTLTPPKSFFRRVWTSLLLVFTYARFAALRLSSLSGDEVHVRRRFVDQVRRELDIRIDFTPWERSAPAPQMVASLFPNAQLPAPPPTAPSAPGPTVSMALLSITGGGLPIGDYWGEIVDRREYFFGTGGNGPLALAIFTALLFTWFLVTAYVQRRRIREARANVPLSIGGWGTRGKSGTERLKAALFGGLGFEVFAKTTGSEAMFVHTAPSGDPAELFIFRPYDKATIWEQRDMLQLGADLKTEVFLWECMALQPGFVELLQNDWMKDDVATLTNAYPDHEDIQGPAGADVASVITNFIPNDGTVICSEDHFLPLFKARAKSKSAKLLHSAQHESELIPKEVLALFPYQEHPRNVALVATLAEQFGVPRSYAIALMAEHVQPEIGVLKVFPPTRVIGRTLTFINGHSANERTGFMNNWTRTGLDAVSCEEHPDRAVVTVINNRWDRVARSEVFARIIVEDAIADRHVLIGSNLEGLQKYIRTALDQYLSRTELVTDEELKSGQAAKAGAARLSRELARLKIPQPSKATLLDRVARYGRGANHDFTPTAELLAELQTAFTQTEGTTSVKAVRAAMKDALTAQLRASLRPMASPPPSEAGLPEVLRPATAEDVVTHALYLAARMVVHARLLAAFSSPQKLHALHETFRAAHRELFLEQLVAVEDAYASGDSIVAVCAASVAPGIHVSIMGSQNIKGTGLDWVYRWLALDRVKHALTALQKGAAAEKERALDNLEAFDDGGLVDSGLAASVLPGLIPYASNEREGKRLEALAARMAAVHAQRQQALQKRGNATAATSLVKGLETVFDYLHSVRRRKLADVVIADLISGRISHPRAALEMRKLYERQKGGWLIPELQLLSQRLRGQTPDTAAIAAAPVPAGRAKPSSAQVSDVAGSNTASGARAELSRNKSPVGP